MHTPEPVGATRTAPRPRPRRLDRNRLLDAIGTRRLRIAELEDHLVAECEAAALRGMNPAIGRNDEQTWDRATWDRYLNRAATLEPKFGPALRRLHEEISRLRRLAALEPAP